MRFSPIHLLLAFLIFGIEVYIAVAVHDDFVRPHLGDVLVVVLLYCLGAAFFGRIAPFWIATIVFLFACAVEIGQALDLVHRLHLGHNRILRIVLGTSYDPADFLAYFAGAGLCLLGEAVVRRARGRTDQPAAR